MVLTDGSYPKKLAFAFLEDISRLFNGELLLAMFNQCYEIDTPILLTYLFIIPFLEELKREFGTQVGVDYRSQIECIDKPYYFIKFERQI